MTTTINININGYGVQTAQESTDRQLPTNGDRQLSGGDVFRWQDEFYTLLPGFTSTRYLYSERKLKKKKKKNCTNGQVCGFSCISKTKVCIADMTTAQLMEHNKAKRLERREKARAKRLAAKGGGGASAAVPFKAGYSKESQSALDSAHKQNLYGVAAGQADTRGKEAIAAGDKAMVDYQNNMLDDMRDLQNAKVERLIKKGLTREEAYGVSSWIGPGYPDVNKTIYAPGAFASDADRQLFEAKSVRLQQGLSKLDSYDAAAMKAEGKKKGAKDSDFEKDTTQLRRGLKIDDAALDQFLAPYKNAKGGEYVEPTFFATTAKKNHNIADKSNVTFVVKAKDDGTGQGKMVDEFKNSNFEGEVLYPAFSRFRVSRVTTKGGLQSSPKSALGSMDSKELAKLPASVQSKIEKGGKLTKTEMSELQKRTEASDDINRLVALGKKFSGNNSVLREEVSEMRREYRKRFKSPALSPDAAQLLKTNLTLGRTAVIQLEEL